MVAGVFTGYLMDAELMGPELLMAELRARSEHALSPFDAAVWRLQLGEADAGLEVIRSSIPQLLVEPPPTPDGAHLALLAGDAEAAARLAVDAMPEVTRRYVAGSREYHGAMLAILAGDDEAATSKQAELDRFVASHDKLRGGQPAAIAQIPRGLLERDGGQVAAGIATLLGWHLRRARARSDVFNSSGAVVSIDAIVAILLAHRRGIGVAVDERFRAATVPLLALYLTEWEGRPLPRNVPLSIVTDLVAGPWLRRLDVVIEDPPIHGPGGKTATMRTARAKGVSTGADGQAARAILEERLGRGGTPWHLAGWALMLGDPVRAREYLRRGAAEARQRWRDSRPQIGGALRWLSKDQGLPNQNFVREHFGFALALQDDEEMAETTPHLQAWLRTQEDRGPLIYAHAHGYLDLICDLLGGGRNASPLKAAVEHVGGFHPSTRVAAIALVTGDAALFRQGLDAILADVAKDLERTSSPPAPLSDVAVHFAVAARRLGVPVSMDERYAAWPVPVDGKRLACDLSGRAVWEARS